MTTTRREFVTASAAAAASLAWSDLARAAQAAHGVTASGVQHADGAPEFTRGIGIYPGSHAEFHGPQLVPAGRARRNLALMRPAYHSSSYDYNLTAQLVTDGIRHTEQPRWVSVSVDGRVLPKEERETILDEMQSSTVELLGHSPVVEIHLGGGAQALGVDRLVLFVAVSDRVKLGGMRFAASGSDDGYTWQALGSAPAPHPLSPENYPPDFARGKHLLQPAIRFDHPSRACFYRLEFTLAGEQEDMRWGLGQVDFYLGEQRVRVGGPHAFTSAWKAAGMGTEWVYVDLGTICNLEHAGLFWIAPAAEGMVQSSSDAVIWHDLARLPAPSLQQGVRFPAGARGRYVRVLMTRPVTAEGYVLSELEVYGPGGLQAVRETRQLIAHEGRVHLGDASWKLQRADLAGAGGAVLARAGYMDASWVPATVPGTVLTSYVNAGAVQEPNYGRNQLYISDSFFYSDFWYRTEFATPQLAGERLSLDFAGINWKAEVYLNGERLGRIKGGFRRARFDVTGKLRPGSTSALAVRTEKNATPGSVKQKTFDSTGKNGGALGADNPTYHASIGWDWIPTIRGRNIGIWDDVILSASGMVTLESPSVASVLPLPDTSRADIILGVSLVNHAAVPMRGTLRGSFGEVTFEQVMSVEAAAHQVVILDLKSHPQLGLDQPRLWWPAGYGAADLYDVHMEFVLDNGESSDSLQFKAGVRQITASEDGGVLRLWVNGRRIVAKGGNWGFSEALLRYGAREYDAAVRYHREMNFNMIRNWVGQIGGDAFYEACDRHGIMVWQDFWLANPWDGPVPDNNELFLANARDLVERIRMHPSVALYCGRNEGFPPALLEKGLRALLDELHPDLHYIPSSADGPVSGHGPYHAQSTPFYFRNADRKLHSEIGAPAIPSMESVRAMMPADALWPQGPDWGLHDFCLHGAQGGTSFREHVQESYGGADSAEEWAALAHFINYDTYRAMFEAQNLERMGLLLWMSHPCWPSFVWQTYDYYLEPTASYFACKKACEPLHIQWNPVTEHVQVVNASAGDQRGLLAAVEVFGPDGARLGSQAAQLDVPEDSIASPIAIQYPASLPEVHFLRLSLGQGGRMITTNFYLRGREQGNFRAIRDLARARVEVATHVVRKGDVWMLEAQIRNASTTPALMVRLQVVRSETGDRILPVIFSDNYIALMPGESRTITAEVRHRDTRGERPRVMVNGFNIDGHPAGEAQPKVHQRAGVRKA